MKLKGGKPPGVLFVTGESLRVAPVCLGIAVGTGGVGVRSGVCWVVVGGEKWYIEGFDTCDHWRRCGAGWGGGGGGGRDHGAGVMLGRMSGGGDGRETERGKK